MYMYIIQAFSAGARLHTSGLQTTDLGAGKLVLYIFSFWFFVLSKKLQCMFSITSRYFIRQLDSAQQLTCQHPSLDGVINPSYTYGCRNEPSINAASGSTP